jgi:L-fuculose-phosphate aldolase
MTAAQAAAPPGKLQANRIFTARISNEEDPMSAENALRDEICRTGRLLWERNLVAATDGNISARLDEGRFLCTPSGVSKGFMLPADLVVVDDDGSLVSGKGRVTSEFSTHLAAYRERPDIGAVVHAHPPKAVAATLAGVSLSEPILPEVLITLGGIPTVDYATPATADGGEAIREVIRQCDAVMIAKHGSVTVGSDPFSAYLKLEKVEHAAETLLLARALGQPEVLGAGEVDVLKQIQQRYCPGTRSYMPE